MEEAERHLLKDRKKIRNSHLIYHYFKILSAQVNNIKPIMTFKMPILPYTLVFLVHLFWNICLRPLRLKEFVDCSKGD